jgi:hypothetical protein
VKTTLDEAWRRQALVMEEIGAVIDANTRDEGPGAGELLVLCGLGRRMLARLRLLMLDAYAAAYGQARALLDEGRSEAYVRGKILEPLAMGWPNGRFSRPPLRPVVDAIRDAAKGDPPRTEPIPYWDLDGLEMPDVSATD